MAYQCSCTKRYLFRKSPGSLDNKSGRRCHLLLIKRWHLLPSFLSNEPGTGLGFFKYWKQLFFFLSKYVSLRFNSFVSCSFWTIDIMLLSIILVQRIKQHELKWGLKNALLHIGDDYLGSLIRVRTFLLPVSRILVTGSRIRDLGSWMQKN
jgi:hypothetical protein